jgi:hypothetical protein
VKRLPVEERRTKRRRWIIHSSFGFFIGACSGMATMHSRVREGYRPLFWIGVPAILCAYLAARYGDRFWEWFTGWRC